MSLSRDDDDKKHDANGDREDDHEPRVNIGTTTESSCCDDEDKGLHEIHHQRLQRIKDSLHRTIQHSEEYERIGKRRAAGSSGASDSSTAARPSLSVKSSSIGGNKTTAEDILQSLHCSLNMLDSVFGYQKGKGGKKKKGPAAAQHDHPLPSAWQLASSLDDAGEEGTLTSPASPGGSEEVRAGPRRSASGRFIVALSNPLGDDELSQWPSSVADESCPSVLPREPSTSQSPETGRRSALLRSKLRRKEPGDVDETSAARSPSLTTARLEDRFSPPEEGKDSGRGDDMSMQDEHCQEGNDEGSSDDAARKEGGAGDRSVRLFLQDGASSPNSRWFRRPHAGEKTKVQRIMSPTTVHPVGLITSEEERVADGKRAVARSPASKTAADLAFATRFPHEPKGDGEEVFSDDKNEETDLSVLSSGTVRSRDNDSPVLGIVGKPAAITDDTTSTPPLEAVLATANSRSRSASVPSQQQQHPLRSPMLTTDIGINTGGSLLLPEKETEFVLEESSFVPVEHTQATTSASGGGPAADEAHGIEYPERLSPLMDVQTFLRPHSPTSSTRAEKGESSTYRSHPYANTQQKPSIQGAVAPSGQHRGGGTRNTPSPVPYAVSEVTPLPLKEPGAGRGEYGGRKERSRGASATAGGQPLPSVSLSPLSSAPPTGISTTKALDPRYQVVSLERGGEVMDVPVAAVGSNSWEASIEEAMDTFLSPTSGRTGSQDPGAQQHLKPQQLHGQQQQRTIASTSPPPVPPASSRGLNPTFPATSTMLPIGEEGGRGGLSALPVTSLGRRLSAGRPQTANQ